MLPKISQKRTDYGLWVCIDKTLRSSAPLREKTLISVVPTALLGVRIQGSSLYFYKQKVRFISKTFTSLHKVLNMKRINRESYTKRILDLLGKNEVIVLTGHRRAKDFLS